MPFSYVVVGPQCFRSHDEPWRPEGCLTPRTAQRLVNRWPLARDLHRPSGTRLWACDVPDVRPSAVPSEVDLRTSPYARRIDLTDVVQGIQSWLSCRKCPRPPDL